jgi:hypothetical protein
MAPACPGLVVLCHGVRDNQHSLVVPDVFDDATWDVPERNEVAKPLKHLQENQEPEPGRFAFRNAGRQFDFRLSRRIQIDQLSTADATL